MHLPAGGASWKANDRDCGGGEGAKQRPLQRRASIGLTALFADDGDGRGDGHGQSRSHASDEQPTALEEQQPLDSTLQSAHKNGADH